MDTSHIKAMKVSRCASESFVILRQNHRKKPEEDVEGKKIAIGFSSS